MIKHLYDLVDLINNYNDGDIESEKKIRDLVCYFSDDTELMSNDLYRNVIFEAAQKMRMFGYVKGTNVIAQDEFEYNDLDDLKHSAIQEYYKSKVYSNNFLDKRQKEIIEKYMTMSTRRILVSAPTSFGKTFLLREILFLNRERYKNVLLIFPTIALLNENTESINKLIQTLRLEYKVINNVYSSIQDGEKHIFILTPERALKLLADNQSLNIDFFFFDEVYKIDDDYSQYEDSQVEEGENELEQDNGNRAKAFRIVLYLLAKSVEEYYLAGPYLNLEKVKNGMGLFLEKNNITTIQVDFEPTSRIEIDAWKMNGVEYHPILGKRITKIYSKSRLTTKEKVIGIVKYLRENNLGQAIFYCSTPSKSMEYTKKIVESLYEKESTNVPDAFIEHLRKKYNVRFENNLDSSAYWSLIHALEHGIGIHHGKFPKYIQNEVLRLFNQGDIEYLFCTSTIIEGVNTNAKNIIIINNSVGNREMTSFALKNIKGRAGRYYHHSMGRVFFTDSKQKKIDEDNEMELNFKLYDNEIISNVDIDNAEQIDLADTNKARKKKRENNFDRILLPDDVFIKNRLYARDVQEKYLRYIMQDCVFSKFKGLIENANSISYFLSNKLIDKILESFKVVRIIDENKTKIYQAVITNYSYNGTIGVLKYHISDIKKRELSVEDKIDSAYIKTFEQIRNIVEYEVPKLLCLFEALFQRAGVLLGYNMDDFNMSTIIRFFELGITTEIGLFLVEYGFPIDTIRLLERKCAAISKMGAVEATKFLSQHSSILYSIMDSYELGLYDRSTHALMNRKL